MSELTRVEDLTSRLNCWGSEVVDEQGSIRRCNSKFKRAYRQVGKASVPWAFLEICSLRKTSSTDGVAARAGRSRTF